MYALHNSISFKYAKKKCVNEAIKKLTIYLEEKVNKDERNYISTSQSR